MGSGDRVQAACREPHRAGQALGEGSELAPESPTAPARLSGEGCKLARGSHKGMGSTACGWAGVTQVLHAEQGVSTVGTSEPLARLATQEESQGQGPAHLQARPHAALPRA